jgi:hypothetical protein
LSLLVRIIVVLTALLGGAAAAAIGFGRQAETRPAYDPWGLRVCKLPCWLNVEPGKTSLREARERLREHFGRADSTLQPLTDPAYIALNKVQVTLLTQNIVGASAAVRCTATDGMLIQECQIDWLSTGRQIAPTLAEMILTLGPPDQVFAGSTQGSLMLIYRAGIIIWVAPIHDVPQGSARLGLNAPIVQLTVIENEIAELNMPNRRRWAGFADMRQYLGQTQ